MAYDSKLADRLRDYLVAASNKKLEEKKIFSGLTFMIDSKMCICVSGDKLMCRFDPALQEEVAEKTGYLPMIMKGKSLNGYCYVEPEGFRLKKDFEYWVKICLAFNPKAKSSKK